MRLFIAIELSDPMKSALTEVQNALRRQGVRGNYTRRENLHLTLAFLGEYNDPETVVQGMGEVPFRPFPLTLKGFGCFGTLYWAGVEPSDALTALVRRLRRVLAEREIPFDRKRFSPHITLLRKAVTNAGLPRIQVPAEGMEVARISLMRSDRGRKGMIYTEIGSIGEPDFRQGGGDAVDAVCDLLPGGRKPL